MPYIYALSAHGILAERANLTLVFDVRDQAGADDLDKVNPDVQQHEAVIRAALDAGHLRTIADVHHGGVNPT
jgi:hypothetical protein